MYIGECVERATFTVTKLLTDVDVVLGMDWLVKWNPVIDWQKQKIYVYVDDHWTQINGMLLDEEHHVGTVKVFDPYTMSDKSEKICLIGPWSSSPKCGPCRKKELYKRMKRLRRNCQNQMREVKSKQLLKT